MSVSRAEARFTAWVGGYFWLPCPVCGQEFGGHEILGSKGGRVDMGNGHGACTCPGCPGDWTRDQAPHLDEFRKAQGQ